jgi:hypothetical protein
VKEASRTGPLKNWLVVEIIERDAAGGKALKFADFLPVVVVDSATQTAMYARSGELIEIGTDRTYYISIASTGERRFSIDGKPIQRLVAGTPLDDDMVFQREFYVVFENGPSSAPLSISPSSAMPNAMPTTPRAESDENELAHLRREMVAMRMELNDVKRQKLLRESIPQQPASRGEMPSRATRAVASDDESVTTDDGDEPAELTTAPMIMREVASAVQCVYRVQFCAVPIEREAERVRAALAHSGIAPTSVEIFLDPRRNITFYRVRGGCFSSVAQSRNALREYSRLAERLRLGVQPMMVRN